MKIAPSAPLPQVLVQTARDMDQAAKQAAAQENAGLSPFALQGVTRSAPRGETPLLIDFMRDGVVTKIEAARIASDLPANTVTNARINVLMNSRSVVFAEGAREKLSAAYGIAGAGPTDSGLARTTLDRLATAIDDAQWAVRQATGGVGSTDESVAPEMPQRWSGRSGLTNFLVDLVADGYMTTEKAKLLGSTYNLNPENKAGIRVLLASADVAFLPGTQKLIDETFDLRRA